MCVIAVCEKRRLTVPEVTWMHQANPHGIGVAWLNRADRLVEYAKGLTPGEAFKLIKRVPLPHVVHFRFASVGAVVPALAHPFPIDDAEPSLRTEGAAPAVLFHNGTWPEWRLGQAVLEQEMAVDAATSGPWSDSRVMAGMMTTYPPDVVAEVVGASQRLVVLHGTGKLEQFGEFSAHRGVTVSNLWWWHMRPQAPAYPKPAKATRKAIAAAQVRENEACGDLWGPRPQPPTNGAGRYFPRVPRPARPARRHR